MGAGAVVAAAAAAQRKRLEQILDSFRIAGATAAERSRSLEDMGVESNAELDQLIRAGVIRTGGGRSSWYLDEAAYIAFRDSQSRRTLRVTLAVVVAALAVVLGVMLATLSRNR